MIGTGIRTLARQFGGVDHTRNSNLQHHCMYTSAGVVNNANSLGWLIANVCGYAKSHGKE